MRVRRLALLLAAGAALLGGCGDSGPIDDPAPQTTPDEDAQANYRLKVSSEQGGTEAIRTSVCGDPSSRLIELPCGLSLGFARVSAPRLYVGRERDRIFLDLEQPATAIFTSLGRGEGERGITRRSAWVRLSETGRRASIGYGTATADLPDVKEPTYLSVLVLFENELPAPTPLASGVPEDAVIRNAAVEYLVQLATRSKADEEG